jgi:hypothetical protein
METNDLQIIRRLVLLSQAHLLAVNYALRVVFGKFDDDITNMPSAMLELLNTHTNKSDDVLAEVSNLVASLAATEAITLRVNPQLHQPAIERCNAIRNLVRPHL